MKTISHCAASAATLLALTCTLPAEAQRRPIPRAAAGSGQADPGAMLSNKLKGARVVRRGNLRSLGARKVELGPGKQSSLSSIAGQIFREQQQLATSLRRAPKGALFGASTSSDEVIELPDSYVLIKRTKATVADPAKLKRSSPIFHDFIGSRTGSLSLKDLDANARRDYAAFKRELAKKPAAHPLRKALKRGDSALLQAVVDGAGELEVVDTYIVPKKPLSMSQGKLQVPSLSPAGTLDLRRKRPVGGQLARAQIPKSVRGKKFAKLPKLKPAPTSKARGSYRIKEAFVNGFTFGDAWEWERKWKFSSGYLRIRASVWYGFAMRIPIEVTGTLSPQYQEIKAPRDRVSTYALRFNARTLDGGRTHYQQAGMPSSKIFNGKEIVLGAGISGSVRLRALWTTLISNLRIGKDVGGQWDMTPPMGSRNRTLFSHFFSYNDTSTGFGSRHLGGGVRLGFKINGDGNVEARFTPRCRSQSRTQATNCASRKTSGRASKQGPTWKASFPNSDLALQATLPVVISNATTRYGYRIDQLKYRVRLSATPGLKFSMNAGYKRWRWRYNKTIWLDRFELPLGRVAFTPHEGTRTEVERLNASKVFRRQ